MSTDIEAVWLLLQVAKATAPSEFPDLGAIHRKAMDKLRELNEEAKQEQAEADKAAAEKAAAEDAAKAKRPPEPIDVIQSSAGTYHDTARAIPSGGGEVYPQGVERREAPTSGGNYGS